MAIEKQDFYRDYIKCYEGDRIIITVTLCSVTVLWDGKKESAPISVILRASDSIEGKRLSEDMWLFEIPGAPYKAYNLIVVYKNGQEEYFVNPLNS